MCGLKVVDTHKRDRLTFASLQGRYVRLARRLTDGNLRLGEVRKTKLSRTSCVSFFRVRVCVSGNVTRKTTPKNDGVKIEIDEGVELPAEGRQHEAYTGIAYGNGVRATFLGGLVLYHGRKTGGRPLSKGNRLRKRNAYCQVHSWEALLNRNTGDRCHGIPVPSLLLWRRYHHGILTQMR